MTSISLRWRELPRKSVALESFAVFILAFLVFRPFAGLGVDSHHDGVVFTTANGVARGLKVNKEVFTQYGPISAWIQGLVLRTFGGDLISLRTASMVALALSVGLFFASWRLLWGRWVAFTAALLWIGCAYFFSEDMPAIPWSSDYALLIQSGVALSATSAIRASGATSKKLLYCAGFLAGLLPFTRLNTGILTILILGALLVLFQSREVSKALCFGLATSMSIVLLVLAVSRSINEWWYQGVVFPRSLYHGQLGSIGLTGLRANLLTNGLPGIGYVLITGLVLRQFRVETFEGSFPRERYRRLVAESIVRAGLLFCWIWLIWMANPRGYLSPLTLQWGVILVAPVLVVQRLLIREVKEIPRADLLVGLAVIGGSLGQLYPTVDLRHVWWASLPAFGLAIAELRQHVSGRVRLVLLSAMLAFPITSIAIDRMDATRTKYAGTIEYASILRGMRVEETFMRAFQPRFTLMRQFERTYGSRPVLNVCQDGLFASVGGRFSLPDPYFVYWPFKKFDGIFEARSKFVEEQKPFIWMCDPLADPATYAGQFGYRLTASPACLREDSKLSSWPWKSVLAVPSVWPELAIEKRWNRQPCATKSLEP